MSDVLAAIGAGAKPMIGMVQLRALAGSSRRRDEVLGAVLDDALAQAALLRDAGFAFLMVQNLGDLPVATQAAAEQIAWMTRIATEVRRETKLPLGLNLLENDAAAMLAIASAADLDFVRVKVYVGAMVTAAGVEAGRAFEAVRARTLLRADGVAIFADVHDRTAVPLAQADFAADVRAAVTLGGADGLVVTGRSHAETIALLRTARDAAPGTPLLAGGGASVATIADIAQVADGAIVGSALKRAGDLFGALDAGRARAFLAAARAR